MRFARDASTRVFYMDRGELWESGTPKQIFENPQRKETRDFIFRVRSWEQTINTLDLDVPAILGSLSEYCSRQFMGRRAANACQLIVEEVVFSQLLQTAQRRGLHNPDIHVTLSAGEGGIDTVLKVDCGAAMLEGGDPFAEDYDDISEAIVSGLCDRQERVEPGVMEFYVKHV
jgi:polar amino acid transport system ATP-binding protein